MCSILLLYLPRGEKKKKSLVIFRNVIDLSKIHEVSYTGYKTHFTAFTSLRNLLLP